MKKRIKELLIGGAWGLFISAIAMFLASAAPYGVGLITGALCRAVVTGWNHAWIGFTP